MGCEWNINLPDYLLDLASPHQKLSDLDLVACEDWVNMLD